MKVKLVRSVIGRTRDQVATVKALGLHKVGDVVEIKADSAILGMVDKVAFLLEVVEGDIPVHPAKFARRGQ